MMKQVNSTRRVVGWVFLIQVAIIFVAMLITLKVAFGKESMPKGKQSRVEVVFCLDTTGSMSGLIEGAKKKIWSIANQIVKGKPTPELHIGLVGYRDKGDDYVTRVFNLDDDLDGVFKNLMSFYAGGGGDTPEHVNKALNDAVHSIDWSKDKKTLKIIFLVGDCPPHMDYQDGYDYHKICEEAVRNDIIINTVQCGDYAETVKFWQEIAKLGEGKYARVEQTGGMQVVETPMDTELAKLNSELEGTIIPYGSDEVRTRHRELKEGLSLMAPEVAAERVACKASVRRISTYDLIDAIKSGELKLKDLKDKDLPDEMRGMSRKERQGHLAKKEEERKRLKVKIEELTKKRSAYILKKLKETGSDKDSFDKIVQEVIKEQASRKGIRY